MRKTNNLLRVVKAIILNQGKGRGGKLLSDFNAKIRPCHMLSATRREFQGLRGIWKALGFSSCVLGLLPSSQLPPLVNKAYFQQ